MWKSETVRCDIFEKAIYDDSGNSANHRIINVRVEVNSIGILFYGSGHLVKGCTAANNSTTALLCERGQCQRQCTE